MYKSLAIILIATFLADCSGSRVVDVKSPCVSTKDGPCGPRRPVNDWWLGKQTVNS